MPGVALSVFTQKRRRKGGCSHATPPHFFDDAHSRASTTPAGLACTTHQVGFRNYPPTPQKTILTALIPRPAAAKTAAAKRTAKSGLRHAPLTARFLSARLETARASPGPADVDVPSEPSSRR